MWSVVPASDCFYVFVIARVITSWRRQGNALSDCFDDYLKFDEFAVWKMLDLILFLSAVHAASNNLHLIPYV